MIDPEQMQDRGLQVVDVHSAFGDVEAEVVGLSVDIAALHAAAGHPQREHATVMVAAIVVGLRRALARTACGRIRRPR